MRITSFSSRISPSRRAALFATVAATLTIAPRWAHADAAAPPVTPANGAAGHASSGVVPMRSRVEFATHASARRLMLDSDFEAARLVIDYLVTASPTPESRAEAAQLSFVLDAWASEERRPRARNVRALPNVPPKRGDWQLDFGAARELILDGAFEEGARRLDDLVVSTTDPIMAARAAELRTLAREAVLRDGETNSDSAATPSESSTSAEPTKATKTHSYGWQTLVVDGGFTLLAPVSPGAALGGYALGAPIVHLTHGRPGVAAASLGLRLGAPTVGFFVAGYGISTLAGRQCSWGCVILGTVGAMAGIATAIVVDAAVLAREKVPAERDAYQTKRAKMPGLASLVPIGGPRTEGGFDLGLGGQF